MPDPKSGKPSLNDARARVARASEHIARLEAEPAALAADKNLAVEIGAGITGIVFDTWPLPPIIGILIGEAV